MALLEGMLGGANAVQAFGQQQFQNKLARDKFDEQTRQYDQNYELAQNEYNLNKVKSDQDTKKFNRDELYIKNDRWIGNAQNQGWMRTDDWSSLDIDKSTQLITQGGQVNDAFILDMANRDVDLPEGFKLDTVDRTTGKIIISGTHKDGTKGVLTVDGKISNDAEVIGLESSQLAQLMNDEYIMNIAGNSNMGSTSALVQMNVARGMSQADAAALAKRQKSYATLQTQVVGEIDKAADNPATGEGTNVGLKRAFRSALAAAETPEAKLSILIEQATAMGIEIPEILVQPAAEEKIETQPEAQRKPTNAFDALAQEHDASVPRETLDEKIARAKKAVDIAGSPTAKRSASTRLKQLEAEKAELPKADGLSSIPNQSEEAKVAATALEEGLFSRIEGMDGEQIKEYINNGGFTPTQEDGENITAVLKDAGVETMADVDMLPTKAQIDTRVWLMMIAPDVQTKDRLGKEISNLLSGSNRADASLLEVQEIRVKEKNAAASGFSAETGRLNYFKDIQKFDWDVSEKQGGRIRDNFTLAQEAIYGLDSDGNVNTEITFDKGRLYSKFGGPQGAFTKMYQDYRDATTPKAQAQTRLALNSMISIGLQALAESEEYGAFGENLLPDGEIDHIGGSDIFLDRLIIKPDGRLAVIDLNSGEQVEETIPIAVVRKLFGETAWAYVKREIEGGPASARGMNKNNQIAD